MWRVQTTPIFFNISENNAIDIDGLGELENNNCWATPQGWVLVRDAAGSSTYLLDPADRSARIHLPHLREDDLNCFCTCLLSDYPDLADPGKNCLVLLIHTDNPVFWYCHVGVDGDDWVKYEYDIRTLPLPDLGEGCCEKLVISPIAACQGKFYFNGYFDKLGVLEFSPAPVFSSIAIRHAIKAPFGFRKVIMVESQNELFMVSLLSGMDVDVVRRVLVHRMDFSEQEWIEAEDLGGRVFLLSSWYFGASRSAGECGLEPDCIYSAHPWEKRLMVFNVEDETMMMQDLDEAPESDQALWLLPTHP